MHLNLFLLFLTATTGLQQVPSVAASKITTAHQAKFLSAEAASEGLTVEMEGLITCVPEGRPSRPAALGQRGRRRVQGRRDPRDRIRIGVGRDPAQSSQ